MISLIVPVYNVKPYLEEFLESVLCQIFEDYEAIFVDDGSTDGSGEVLDLYKNRCEKFRVIHKINGGVISAWKRGIAESKGEYIAFADPDDILLPEMLYMQYQFMSENNADIVITGIKRLEEGKLKIANADQWHLSDGLYSGDDLEYLKKNLFGNSDNPCTIFYFWKPNKLFKKDVLLRNIEYSKIGISFGEDVCISASAIYDCNRLYYSHVPLYIYRIRDSSLTTVKFNISQIDDAYLLVNAVRQMIKEKGYMTEFVYYNEPSYHILRLMRKIKATTKSKKEKKNLMKVLKCHKLMQGIKLSRAKKFISRRRFIALWLLKHSMYSILLKLL